MSGFITFMNGIWGRLARIIVGVALIAYGLLALGGTAGIILAIVGLVPLVMGLWGHCLVEAVSHPSRPTA
jgi:Inner membrane protein YgaP-like, transmembrane domain